MNNNVNLSDIENNKVEKVQDFTDSDLVNLLNSLNMNLDFLKMEIITIINMFNFWKDISNVKKDFFLSFNEKYLDLKKILVNDILKNIFVDEAKWNEFISLNLKNEVKKNENSNNK